MSSMRVPALCLSLLLVVWLALLAAASPALAVTYYVATNGSDSNSCGAAQNITTPRQSVANGASCLTPGDTLYIRGGTYNVGPWGGPPSGTSSARVTMAGYPQDGARPATLNVGASGENGITLNGKNWITIDNLVLNGPRTGSTVLKLNGGSSNIRVTNTEIRNGGTQGVQVVEGGTNNLFLGLSVHDNGTTSLEHGFYFEAPHNTIDGCDIYNHTGFGIHNFHMGDPTVNEGNIARNNRIHDNGYGLLMSNGANQQGYNNLIYNQSNWGIQNYDGAGALIVNNTVWNNAAQAAIISDASTVRNNIFYQNGSGIEDDSGGTAVFGNNLTTNPSFETVAGGDFHLQSGSAAIDAGTNAGAIATTVTTDFDGNTRPQGSAWDIGAYEFTTGAPPPPPSQDPVAWWKFDEGTGTSAGDSTGHGHTGTLVGGATWTTGRIGTFALQLDGVNDAVTLTDNVLTSFSADQSVCLWARATTTTALGPGGFKQTLLNLGPDTSNGVRLVLHESTTPVGTFWVTILAGGTTIAAGTTAQVFVNNSWVHLCYTLTSSVLKIYVNSVQASTVSNDAFTHEAGTPTIGARDSTTGNFGGSLDQVKIWNRALAASEVLTEFGATVAPKHRVVIR